ncbi:MAG: hypothetical protein IRZ21_03265 [Thermoleophilaceae bacterium]|nr:hypothetical protein [Thermoleophilaceae bacterium]
MDLIAEGAAGELRPHETCDASVLVRVEASRSGFDTSRFELLARGAWRRNGEVVLENPCTAGFDVHVRRVPERIELTYRWRPPARDRAAAWALRSRFHLLARAVLIQYPALWRAGTRGRAPLHASACTAGNATPLLTAQSGIGRSTVLLGEVAYGSRATGDNLAVGDGTTIWGLVEPLRVARAGGRRMPHGRQEAPMPGRVPKLVPDRLVVLERGRSEQPSLEACSAQRATRALVTSTYMAGELRRYWSFAAALSAGTGVGPAHPPVEDVAAAFAATLPCFSLSVGRATESRLAVLLDTLEVAA